MGDELSGAIEALRIKASSQIEALRALPEMGELIKVHAALNTLEGLCGIEPTPLSALFGLDSAPTAVKKRLLVKVGEYYGKSPLEAAKAYLKAKGEPATLDEIVENLKIGSCEVKNEGDLRVSLGRSTFEIARLNEDTFGMLDWFPDVKKSRLAGGRKKVTVAGEVVAVETPESTTVDSADADSSAA